MPILSLPLPRRWSVVAFAAVVAGALVPYAEADPVFETVQALTAAAMNPNGTLLADAQGNLHGVTSHGGYVYQITPAGAITLEGVVRDANVRLEGTLARGGDGLLYGFSTNGGSVRCGTIFRILASGEAETLHEFDDSFTNNSCGGLTTGPDGALYGVTGSGGAQKAGTFFRVTTAGTFETLLEFGTTTARFPLGPLVAGEDGFLYGVTANGGSADFGTAFRLHTNGQIEMLASFTGTNGQYPRAGLALGEDGYFYGTTEQGGSTWTQNGQQGYGTVFRMSSNGAITTLASFGNRSISTTYQSPLVMGPGNAWYGVRPGGAINEYGSVFKLSGTQLSTVVNFNGTNGDHPAGGLTAMEDGTLYGVTNYGGPVGGGTFYRISPAGQFSVVGNFRPTGGYEPHGQLLAASDGNYYASTRLGGTNDDGTVFRMTPEGVVATLGTMSAAQTGAEPLGGLAEGPDGQLYGTTNQGGANNYGTFFRLPKAGGVPETIIPMNEATGAWPDSTPLLHPNGSLYFTTTYYGYPNSRGMLLGWSEGNPLSAISSFQGSPRPNLCLDPDSFRTMICVATAPFGTYQDSFISAILPDGSGGTDLALLLARGPENGPMITADGHLYYTVGDTIYRTKSHVFETVAKLPQAPGVFLPTAKARLVEGPDEALYGSTLDGGAMRMGYVFHVTKSGTVTVLHTFTGPDGRWPMAEMVKGQDGNLYGITMAGGRTADDRPADGGQIFRLRFDTGITTQAATKVTGTTAILHGLVYPNGHPVAAGFQYSTSASFTNAITVNVTTLPASAAETPYQLMVTGLTPGATYHVRAFAALSDKEETVNGADLPFVADGVDPAAGDAQYLFTRLDTERDDLLSPAEWAAIYVTLPKKETIFAAIDTNLDGFVSYAEFQAAQSNRTASKTIATAVERTSVFLDVDADGDGTISRAEIGKMWKPGTAAATVDVWLLKSGAGDDVAFSEWLRVKTLPNTNTFRQAATLRATRHDIAARLDTDHDSILTFAEFSHLYKAGTKTATIDTAWRAANGTARGIPSPASMTMDAFIEAAKLPKLVIY